MKSKKYEKMIAEDAVESYLYAILILDKQFLLGEKIMATDKDINDSYKKFLKRVNLRIAL